MTTLVRRQHPRTTLRLVAYMEIEPGIGGIILNVSRGGLCFQAVAPVDRGEVFRFAFKENNRRMAGCGELAWLDERGKCGGVRFTNLSPEAREQVDEWLASPEDEDAPIDQPRLRSGAGRPSPAPRHNHEVAVAPSSFARKTPAAFKVSIKGSAFSTGLITGLLIATVSGAMLLLGYVHRHDLGEALVSMGQRMARMAARTHVQTAAVQPEAQSQVQSPQVQVSPTVPPIAPAESPAAAEQTSAAADATKLASTDRRETIPPLQATGAQQNDLRAAQDEDDRRTPLPEDETRILRPKSGSPPLSTIAASSSPNDYFSYLVSPPLVLREAAPAIPSLARNTGAPVTAVSSTTAVDDATVQMYLDIGKFNDRSRAQEVRDSVAHLGLRTTVLKSRFLWKTSYQVLVGPYEDESDQTSVQGQLRSKGYDPRPFERGSRQFSFRSRVNLNGSQLPTGDFFTISWESYVENAIVRIRHGAALVATARGRWVERREKFSQDEYVYLNGPEKTLTEIHFAGQKRVLSFAAQ